MLLVLLVPTSQARASPQLPLLPFLVEILQALVPAGRPAANHLVEQLIPTRRLGQRYLTVPLATRTVVTRSASWAQQDNTQLRIDGSLIAP